MISGTVKKKEKNKLRTRGSVSERKKEKHERKRKISGKIKERINAGPD